MKKKMVTICLVVALVLTAVAGGSLAYFTDTDAKDNVFTVGNVDIQLNENFEQNSKLMPGSKDVNNVKKEVYVTNLGSEEAYVRVHIAIPQILDNGDPSFDASKNVLHFNYDAASVGEGLWDWSDAAGAPYEGAWNYYETTIDNIDYNVYVVTYTAALTEKNQNTAAYAMNNVYLDSTVTQADIERINTILGSDWEIKVVAEAGQADGFATAYDALNTQFGAPGTYNPFQ